MNLLPILLLGTMIPYLESEVGSTTDPIKQCPEHKTDFTFCEGQREKCVREHQVMRNCTIDYCICLKEIQAKSRECKVTVEDLCVLHLNHLTKDVITDEKVKIQLEEELFNDLDGLHESIKNHCFPSPGDYEQKLEALQSKVFSPSELFLRKYSHIIIITDNTSTGRRSCRRDMADLLTQLKAVESGSKLVNKVAYNQWHCGWENGDFGRVVMRKTAEITSFYKAEQFNLCCAKHRDCFGHVKSISKCNGEFEECTEKVVKNSKSHERVGTKLYKQYLVEKLPVTSNRALLVDENTTYHFATDSHDNMLDFHGFCEQQGKLEKCSVVLGELSKPFETYDQKKLIKVYKVCKNHSITISFLEHLARRCVENNGILVQCTVQLDNAMSDVCSQADEAKETMMEGLKLVDYISSLIPTWAYWLLALAEFLISLGCCSCIWSVWKRMQNQRRMEGEDNRPIEMNNLIRNEDR